MHLSMSMVASQPHIPERFAPQPPSAPPPPSSTGLSSAANHIASSQAAQSSGKQHRQRVCSLLVPVLAAVAAVWVLQLFSHQEALVESYNVVFMHGLLNAKAHVRKYTDPAVVVCRGVGLEMAEHRLDHVGTSAMDNMLWRYLQVESGVSQIVVATSAGTMSGVERLANGSHVVFSVDETGAQGWAISATGVRLPGPVLLDSSFLAAGISWFVASNASVRGDAASTQWHSTPEASSLGDSADMAITCTRWHPTLTADRVLVAVSTRVSSIVPSSSFMHVPFLAQQPARFSEARGVLMSEAGMVVACSHPPCATTGFGSSEDLVTSSIHALLTTFGSLSSVPGSWTQSGLYSNSVCVLRIGTGETQPAWLLVVVVPPDSIRMSRVVEMVVSAVFCMLLLASILVAWALGTSVKGYHGPGVPRTRVVSMLGVAAVVCGLFVLWELSAQPGRDEVLLDLSTCIHAHATQEMANLVAPVRTIAALAAAAGEDHTVNLTQAALATTGDELERFLGRLVEATTETTTVVAGTMLGLANGDLFAALPTNEPEFQVVGRRSASTSHLLTFSPTHPGNWSRVSGSPLLLPAVSFDASQEAWFIAADGKREAWSPVFSLPYSNHHGVAATASFGNTSCATAGQDGVWGVMIDARALEQSMVTVQASIGFGMATAATVPAPETFVATGDLTQLTLLASSDSTSLQLDASTGTVTRVVVTQSSTDTIATVGKQLAAWSSTSLTASDLPYKSEMTSMGFGMDELLVSVLWMDDHVPVKGINWTAVLVLSKEAVRSPHREWTSVSLVVTVPVLFAAVMLSIALRPGHDLISAAARRWGMARGVLLAAVGRPLPLSLEKSLQKRQQERLERLADKALKAVQALAVRRRRSTTTQQRFWRSRSRQSYVMDSGQSLFDTQTNNGGIRRRRRLGPNPSVRQEMLTATTGLPPMPGIATQPRRVGVSSSFGLESPNHPHHGQQGRQGMLGVAQSFLVNEHDRRNSGGAEFAAEASRLADSSADVSQFQAGVAEHQPHDARPSHHAFARRSSTDASGPVHVSSVEDSTMSVGSGAGDMDAELADSIATVNLLEESVHDQARVITVAPDPGNTRLQQVSVSGRSDVPTESVDGVVSDGARRLEAPKAPRFTGVGSTEEVRSASHPVPPQHSSNASPEPAAGETATQIGASQASSVLSAANVVDDPDDIILAPYEEPNCMVALGEHLPSRRQVVGCYEQVVQFIDDTIEFEDAHTPIGVVPDAALRCRPCQQRFVLAAIAVSGVPDSQRGDIVAVAHSIVNQAYAGSNVMHHWFMHIASGSATARRTVAVSQLLRAAWYRRSISAVVITHMVLTFWEGSSPESRPASRTPMYLAQAAILVVYALDTVLYWYGYCRSQPFGANLGVHASFAGNIAEISKRAAVRLVFTLVFVIDLVVQYHTDYTTGPGTFIPYTSLLRPVFLLSRSSPMRRAVSNFASTLVLSRKVILLSLAFVSVAVVTSVALLGRVDGIAEGTATAFVADTFGVAEAFLINVFVFVATGENYPDVVVPAGAEHSALVVYFMVLEVAGLLILSSLLIAFFQQFYNRLYELSTSARRRRQLTIRQLSLMLAFRLMQLVDTDKTTRAAMLHTQARRRGLRTRAQLRAAGGPSGLSVVTEASVETAGSVTDSAQCSASGTASAEVRGVSSTEQVASDSQAASDIPFEDAQSHTEESVSSLTQGLRQQVSLPDSTDSDSIPSAPRSMGRRRTTRPRGLKVDTSSTTPGFPQAHPFQPISYTGRGDRHAEMLKRLSTAAHLLVNTRSLATSMSRMMFVRFFQTFGVNLTELGRVQYDEHQRLGCFRMDAAVVAERMRSLSRQGCTSEFLAVMQEFGKRCSGIHAQAMPVELHNRSIYEFIAVCDRSVDPRIENNRRRRAVATLAQTDNMMHFTTSRTCCTRRIYCTLRRSKGLVTFLQRFFDNEASVRFQTVLVLVLVFHGCALALTATTLKTAALNTLPVFLFCFGTEILLRLFAEGPGDFWTFYRLNSVEGQSRGSYRAQALRFDCCITTGVLLAYGIMKIFDLTPGFVSSADLPVLCLPSLRLLSTVETTRGLVFGLVGSLPSFYPLFALLMLMVYDYAVVGVWFFGGLVEKVANYEDKEVNFSTMFNSTVTMFQLLIGEAWHEVMLAAVFATSSLLPLLFFCSYIVFVLLIFGNVFTGVICDRFQSMESEERMRLHRMDRERTQIEKSAARTLQKFYFRKVASKYAAKRAKRRASMAMGRLQQGHLEMKREQHAGHRKGTRPQFSF